MAVVFDAKGSADQYTPVPGSPVTYTGMTVGSGSNRALIVMLASDVTLGTVVVHWDSLSTNQLMTLIGSYSSGTGNGFVYLYGLIAPTNGNKTLSVTSSNALLGNVTDLFIDAVSFTGVNQTGGATTFYNETTATGSGNSTNLVITSASSDAAVALGTVTSTVGWSSINQTEIFLDNSGAVTAAVAAYNINSSSVTFTFTPPLSGSSNSLIGCAIAAVAAAATTPFVYYDFSAKPQPMKSPEDKWLPAAAANLLTNLYLPTVLNTLLVPLDFYRHSPAPPKGPEFIFPNNVLQLVVPPNRLLIPFDFSRHPSTPPKGPEFIFPNLALLENAQVPLPYLLGLPLDFYRHSPAPPKGPEFIFPNIVAPYPYEVQPDAIGTADVYVASGTSATFNNLTVSSQPNRALVGVFSFSGDPGTVTATWDSGGSNQVMIEEILFSQVSGVYVALFGLVAPVSGNKTLAVSWTNTVAATIDAMSFYNAAQTATFYGVVSTGTVTGGASVTVVKNSLQDASISAGARSGTHSWDIGISQGPINIYTDDETNFGGAAGYEYAGMNFGEGLSVSHIYSISSGAGIGLNVAGMAIAAFYSPGSLNPLLVPFDFDRHPPPYVRGPDFIFPDLALIQGVQVNPLPQLLRLAADPFYRHPPAPPKGPEFIFPNLPLIGSITPLPDLLRRSLDPFYRHPPVSWRTPEFIFPDMALLRAPAPGAYNLLLVPIDFNRHPPRPPLRIEFLFPNLVLVDEVVRVYTPPVEFIRNIEAILQVVRATKPGLELVRQAGAELQVIRSTKPTLDK